MTALEKIDAQIAAETAGMTADERFHFYRQRDDSALARAGLTRKSFLKAKA